MPARRRFRGIHAVHARPGHHLRRRPVLQFGGGTTVTPVPLQVLPTVWPSRPASRHATPAVIRESRDILMEAAKHSPELAIALETWKEIKFEFDTVDKLDVQN